MLEGRLGSLSCCFAVICGRHRALCYHRINQSEPVAALTTFYQMKPVFLAGAVRTPIGRFGGSLKDWTAADLGVAVAKEALRRAKVAPEQVEDSIWGCARQAAGGPNVARQITWRAGVPDRVPAFTVNQACGSGLRAIRPAAGKIMLGRAAGGLA